MLLMYLYIYKSSNAIIIAEFLLAKSLYSKDDFSHAF